MKNVSLHIVFVLMQAWFVNTAMAQNDFVRIRNAVAKTVLEGQAVDSLGRQCMHLLQTLQPNGSWPDIDYTDDRRTNWQPILHLSRLTTIVAGYAGKSGQYKGNEAAYAAIVSALQFWYQTDSKSTNWWHNQIAVPQALGEMLIVLMQAGRQLPTALQDSLLVRMNRGDMLQQTGANKVDVALHNLYRASIAEDTMLMRVAVEQAFSPIAFTTDEGLQYDFSNMQHGPQMMIGSYGFVFVNAEYKIASFLHGTRYAISKEKLRLLTTFFNQVFLKAVRGSFMDFNTEGRGISRKNMLDKREVAENRGLAGLINIACLLDSGNQNYLLAAGKRLAQTEAAGYKVAPYHAHFWKADYSLHVRPAYSFNVRMASTRTLRTETGNEENLLGNFLPDGATNIQRRGGEYNNIMPVWEWDKIPGTTSHGYDGDDSCKIDKDWGIPGSTSFVGGVSDSVYGASAYELDYKGVKAKKAWFFFDKEVVCLGAGISSSAVQHVTTTINQCWLNSDVDIVDKAGKQIKQNENSNAQYNHPAWVLHDSIGYFFNDGADVAISNKTQMGSWYRINHAQSKDTVGGNVFTLLLNHGARPGAGKYAYTVVLGIGSVASLKNYQTNAVQIIANTESLQAVAHTALNITYAVFYKPGKCENNGILLQVDKPCIVYLHNTGNGNAKLFVADPTQQLASVAVRVKLPEMKAATTIHAQLPTGVYAGSTTVFSLSKGQFSQ